MKAVLDVGPPMVVPVPCSKMFQTLVHTQIGTGARKSHWFKVVVLPAFAMAEW